MKERKNNHLLIKLFVIIVTIIIIIVILFPAIQVNRYHSEAMSKAHMQRIFIAIEQYEAKYGELPWINERDKQFSEYVCSADYDQLFELLTCLDSPDPGIQVTGNKRSKHFLVPPKDFNVNSCRDAWGNKFKIFLDTNYDMKVNVNGNVLKGKIFIYSFGKNKKDDFGKNDDIILWE